MKKRITTSEQNAPIDKEALWNDIATHPDFPRKKRKNRPAFIFLLFSVMIIPMVGLMYYYSDDNNAIQEERTEVTTNQTSDDVRPQDNSNTIASMENNNSKKPFKNEALTKEITPSSRSFNKVSKIESFSVEQANHALASTSNPIVAQEETSVRMTTAILDKGAGSNRATIPTNTIESIPTLLKELNENDVIPNLAETKKIEKSKIRNWSLGLSAALGLGFHDINSSDSNALFHAFENHQKLTEAYSFGLYLERRFRNHKWSIAAQANYSLFFTELKHENSITKYRMLNQNTSPYFAKIDSTSYYNIFHHHKILDGQLELGRNFLLSETTRLRISAGVGFNMSYQVTGKVLEQNALSDIPDNVYKKKLRPYYILGVNYSRSIGGNFRWGLGASFRTSRLLSAENYSFEHRYFQSNIYSSIEYMF